MVDISIWGKQSPPAGKLMTCGVNWPLLIPITLPPTFSSVLPDWAVHPLTQRLHCFQHRSSVLFGFLAAWCSQSGSHRKRAQVKGVLEMSKPLIPSSAIYPQCDPETYHKHYRSVSSSLIWGPWVVFIYLLFGFNEGISHKRHQMLLAEILMTVRITEWLPAGRRQDSWPETVTGRRHWSGARPLAKVCTFHLPC